MSRVYKITNCVDSANGIAFGGGGGGGGGGTRGKRNGARGGNISAAQKAKNKSNACKIAGGIAATLSAAPHPAAKATGYAVGIATIAACTN